MIHRGGMLTVRSSISCGKMRWDCGASVVIPVVVDRLGQLRVYRQEERRNNYLIILIHHKEFPHLIIQYEVFLWPGFNTLCVEPQHRLTCSVLFSMSTTKQPVCIILHPHASWKCLVFMPPVGKESNKLTLELAVLCCCDDSGCPGGPGPRCTEILDKEVVWLHCTQTHWKVNNPIRRKSADAC